MGIVSKYFVIKPRSKTPSDPYATAARRAMMTFAREVQSTDEDLAKSLRLWAVKEQQREDSLVPVKVPVFPEVVELVPGEVPRECGAFYFDTEFRPDKSHT